MSSVDRKRDLSHITPEQEAALQAKLSAKLQEILDRASKEAEQLLNPFGIQVKIGFVLKEEKAQKRKKASKA